jgi:hypothetical protein
MTVWSEARRAERYRTRPLLCRSIGTGPSSDLSCATLREKYIDPGPDPGAFKLGFSSWRLELHATTGAKENLIMLFLRDA